MGVKRKIKNFWIERYEWLFRSAESRWNQHFNEYSKGYSAFRAAVSSTFTDFKQYFGLKFFRIVSDVPSHNLSGLTRNDLRVLRTVPRDMIRLVPLLVAVALPGTIALLPFFFAFPHVLLTRAFWNEKQRQIFDEADLRRRLIGPNAGLTNGLSEISEQEPLQRQISGDHSDVESAFDDRKLLKSVLNMLSKNETPSSEAVVQLIGLFDGQLNLNALDHRHITLLCGLHGIVSYRKPLRTALGYRRPFGDFLLSPINLSSRLKKLERRAQLIYAEDQDISLDLKRGKSIPHQEVMELCILRGVNGYALCASELEEILRKWTELSVKASATSHSYRLHLPFLLNFKQYLR